MPSVRMEVSGCGDESPLAQRPETGGKRTRPQDTVQGGF
jgi:hypothetical protein